MLRSLKKRKRTMRSERKRTLCPTLQKINPLFSFAKIFFYRNSTTPSPIWYKEALNHRSQWLCSHWGWLVLRVTSATPRNRRFAPLGFYCIPTYCLISVYHPVRAADQFIHWLNSSWQPVICARSMPQQRKKYSTSKDYLSLLVCTVL